MIPNLRAEAEADDTETDVDLMCERKLARRNERLIGGYGVPVQR